MARKRMLDPSIWANETFGRLSPLARLLYIGMISIADDEGRLKSDLNYLKASILPYDNNITKLYSAYKEVIKSKLAIRYMDKYLYHPNWTRWQKINRPTPSSLPSPHGVLNESSMSPHCQQNRTEQNRTEQNTTTTEDNRTEQNRTEQKPVGELSDLLLSVGFTKTKAISLIATYGIDRVKTALGKSTTAQHRTGWIIRALERNYI